MQVGASNYICQDKSYSEIIRIFRERLLFKMHCLLNFHILLVYY